MVAIHEVMYTTTFLWQRSLVGVRLYLCCDSFSDDIAFSAVGEVFSLG